jgi:sugar lactone lactonase YvrE
MPKTNSVKGLDVSVSKLTNGMEESLSSGLGSPAAFIGKNLANGIVGWGGGQAIGWVFHSLGYRTSTEQMLEESREMLEKMSNKLDNIQKNLDRIELLQMETINKIELLADELREVFKGLKWENEIHGLQARSSTIVTAIVEPVSKIKVTFDYLQRISKLDPSQVDAEIRQQMNKTVDEILSPINGIEPCIEALNVNITGSLGEKGLLEVWSNLIGIGATSNNLGILYKAFEDRFAFLLEIELLGMALMVDAYHFENGIDMKIVSEFWQCWKNKIIAQIELFLRSVEKIFASRIDNLTAVASCKFVDTPPINNNQKYIAPLLLREADQFVRDISGSFDVNNEPRQGFITLRAFHFPGVTGGSVQNVGLIFEEIDKKSKYQAQSVEQRGGATIPDKDFKTVDFQVICYNFSVPFGTYKLSNENNNPLVGKEESNVTTTVSEVCRYGAQAVIAFSDRIKFYSEVKKKPETYVNRPAIHAAAVDNAGNIYVLDSYTVVKFNSKGQIVTKWGIQGVGEGHFTHPEAIEVDPNGNVYICDNGEMARIQKFDPNGKFIAQWGTVGTGKEEFKLPTNMAIDKSGYIYVTDGWQYKIKKFDLNGRFITQWGTDGSGDGQFIPTGVSLDSNGNVYVSDALNCRIQVFDLNGKFLTKWGTKGSDDGQFLLPKALVVDAGQKCIYVSDNTIKRVQKFSLDGKFIRKLQLNKDANITGVTVDKKTGTLYIADLTQGILQAWFSVVFVSRNW